MKRRIISVTLAVLIFVSGFSMMLPFSATAASTNLIANGTFESGDVSGWEVYNNSGNSTAAFTVTGDATNKVATGISGLSMFKQVTLEAGVQYTMMFDFKFAASSVPTAYDSFYRAGFAKSVSALGNGNFAGPNATGNIYYSIYSAQGTDKTAWKRHSFTFTPTSTMTTYAVVGSYNNQGASDFSVDNVVLCKASDLVTITAVAESGGTAAGTIVTCKGENVTVSATPSSGNHFVGWYNGITFVSSLKNYTFSSDAAVTLTAKFGVGVQSTNMLTGGNFDSGLLTGWEVNNNSGNASAAFAFEGDTNKVLKGVAGLSLFKQVALEAGVEYTMSFDFKFADASVPAGFDSFYRAGFVSAVAPLGGSNFVGPNAASSNKYYDIYNAQKTDATSWKTHTFKFTPATAMTVYAVVGSYNNQGVSAFSVDNLVLCKASDLVTIGVTAETGGTVTAGKTACKGDPVSVTATANANFTFQGWFVNDVAVSTDLTYTFYAESNVNLVAKFATNKINLIKNSDFEDGSWTTGWTKLGSSLSYIWDVGSAAFGSGDSAQFNGTRYVKSGASESAGYTDASRSFGQKDIALAKNTDYVLAFWAKSDLPTFRAGVIKNDQAHPITSMELAAGSTVALDKGSSWAYYAIPFNSGSNTVAAVSFGGQLSGIAGKYYYIDNVVLSKKSDISSVSLTAFGPGSVSSNVNGVVTPGTEITLTATPFTGAVFDGWYLDSTLLSTSPTFKYTVSGSVTIVGQFKNATGSQKLYNSHFETGDLTGWRVSTLSGAPSITLAKEGSQTYAKIPTDNMLYQPVALKPGGVYVLTVKSRTPNVLDAKTPAQNAEWYRAGLFGLNTPNVKATSCLIPNQNTYVGLYTTNAQGKADAGWHTYTYTFTNGASETVYANVVIGNAYNAPDLQFEYATFYEVTSGIMEFTPAKQYGEEFYNFVGNGTFEQALSNDNWGSSLPSGWSISSGHKETGSKYLTVSGSEKIYALKVDPGTVYCFGVSLKAEKSGNSAFALVDKNGALLGDSYGQLTQKAIYQPSANGQWQRFGAKLFVDTEGYIYFKLSGKDNALSIDDITVVKERYSYEQDPNYYGGASSYDYNNPKYFNPERFYALDNTAITGGGSASDDSSNAETGDNSSRVLFICFAAVLSCGVLLKLTFSSGKIKKEVKCK